MSYAYPTEDRDTHRDRLNQLRKDHPKAVHVCNAYRLRCVHELQEFQSDDGEPSGSSGMPLLNQLRRFELQNVSLLVVRYFGGTKLGIPGLIKAYGAAAQDALEQAGTVEKVESLCIRLNCGYHQLGRVMRLIDQMAISILHQEFSSHCAFTLSLPPNAYEAFENQLPFEIEIHKLA